MYFLVPIAWEYNNDIIHVTIINFIFIEYLYTIMISNNTYRLSTIIYYETIFIKINNFVGQF